jgi:KaiC/GvpD/RAD55 family RecA-like ATPase
LTESAGIPTELVNFFKGPGGHSLIVKGLAGTGKTTFALQLAEELESIAKSHYISVRVSDESLYNQFPWLRKKLAEKEKLKMAKSFAKTLTSNYVHQEKDTDVALEVRIRTAQQLLQSLEGTSLGGQKVDRQELQKLEGRIEMGEEGMEEDYGGLGDGSFLEDTIIFDLGSDLPEIDLAYDMVEQTLPDKTLVLIDSIDALSERYGVHSSKLINTLQKDLVEHSQADVLYILETGMDNKLDYLGDGVISFGKEEYKGRRLRILNIEKLRGTEITQHKYIYTLKDGRLQTFAFKQEEMPPEMKAWKAVQDISEDVVSTGNEELDELIGGVKKGSIIAIEVGGNVPSYYIDNIKAGIISNFAAQNRGVAFLPSKRAPAEIVASQIAPYLGEDVYNKYVRVFEALQLETFVGAENAMALDGGEVGEDLKWKKIEYSLQDSKHPYLSILSFDTLESIYGGGELVEGLTAHLTSIRRDKDIFVGILLPTDESIGKLTNVAHTHLKIENIDGSVVLYGEKPFTELFALSFDVSKGYPKANLTPIV